MVDSGIYLHLSGNSLLISFEYDQAIKDRVKQIPGARFNKNLSRWECSIAQYDSVVTLLDNLKISAGVMQKIGEITERKRRVQELKDKPYHEIEDYVPKLPLYSHQKKQFELNRILDASGIVSDVGCGKTPSTICAIHWRILMGQVNKCLVVCPLNVISNWKDELEKFSDLTYTDLLGNKDQRAKKLSLDRQVYLINYEGLRVFKDQLLKKEFQMMVADEAHRLKTSTSQQSMAAYEFGDLIKYKIALTATPVCNSLEDVYGIFRWLSPDLFGTSFYAFRNRYFINVSPQNAMFQLFVPKGGSEEQIQNKMYSISMRFRKSELTDLPPFTILPNRIATFTPELDRAYETLQKNCFIELSQQEILRVSHFLAVLMKLSQLTSGFFKVSNSDQIVDFDPNPKFEELKAFADDLAGEPLVIWAYYVHDIKKIFNYFARCQKCQEFTNNTRDSKCPKCGTAIKRRVSAVWGGAKNKFAEVASFRFTEQERAAKRTKMEAQGASPKQINDELGEKLSDGEEVPQRDCIVLQIGSGSEGISLVRSCYAIYYSRDYNWKNLYQSMGRTHRGGQTRNVSYINLVCCRQSGEDTIDQKILKILKKKDDLSARINKDNEASKDSSVGNKITREDLKFLIEDVKNEEASKVLKMLEGNKIEEDVVIENLTKEVNNEEIPVLTSIPDPDAIPNFKKELFS